jgi:hypothetical protein
MHYFRPYQGVLAERQIRRLKSQVFTERVKHLKGRPKHFLEESLDMFEASDQVNISSGMEATVL